MLTAERLEEIKEYANNNRQHVILNDTHILIDNLAEHTLDLADEVERLRAALEKIAYTPAFKSQAEIEAFADQVITSE